MTNTDLIQQAADLLAPADIPTHDLARADSLARLAIAQALHTLTETTDYQPPTRATPNPWPPNVTARILTRGGILTNNQHATVDIHDTAHRSTALCQPCGWVHDQHIDDRDKALSTAQDHASQCTALAHPAAA